MSKDIKVSRQYNIFTSQDLALKEKSKDLNISVSQIIRKLINEYLNSKESTKWSRKNIQ